MTFPIVPATKEDVEDLYQEMRTFNKGHLAFPETYKSSPLNYVIKEHGVTIAGVEARFYFENALHVQVLFVNESYRGKGLGSRLLEKVEMEAKALGATLSHLDTFDFQAKDFYLKQGYEIFGVLEDCPKGHKRYYMKKTL